MLSRPLRAGRAATWMSSARIVVPRATAGTSTKGLSVNTARYR
jgi:hypothetical protein